MKLILSLILTLVSANAGTLVFGRAPLGNSYSNNVVAYYRMDETSGNRVDVLGVSPLVESGALGSITGIITNALSFTGTSRFVSCADNANLSMGDIDFGIIFWFRIATDLTECIFSKGPDASNNGSEYQCWYDATTKHVKFYVGNGSASGIAIEPTNLSLNTWYYCVCTHDSTLNLVEISVNGAAFTTVSYSGGSFDSTNPLRIGASGTGFNIFQGAVDEFQIFKRLLTTADISFFYNGGAGKTWPY